MVPDVNVLGIWMIAGVFSKQMVIRLSQFITYLSSFIPSSPRNHYIHNIYFQDSFGSMYYAFVVERVTTFCSLEIEDTVSPAKVYK